MKVTIFLIAGPLFLLSFGAYVFVRIYMYPRQDSDLEHYYAQTEEYHPAYARYLKWSRITLSVASISALLLFICAYLF
jgi:hypothetical protein